MPPVGADRPRRAHPGHPGDVPGGWVEDLGWEPVRAGHQQQPPVGQGVDHDLLRRQVRHGDRRAGRLTGPGVDEQQPAVVEQKGHLLPPAGELRNEQGPLTGFGPQVALQGLRPRAGVDDPQCGGPVLAPGRVHECQQCAVRAQARLVQVRAFLGPEDLIGACGHVERDHLLDIGQRVSPGLPRQVVGVQQPVRGVDPIHDRPDTIQRRKQGTPGRRGLLGTHRLDGGEHPVGQVVLGQGGRRQPLGAGGHTLLLGLVARRDRHQPGEQRHHQQPGHPGQHPPQAPVLPRRGPRPVLGLGALGVQACGAGRDERHLVAGQLLGAVGHQVAGSRQARTGPQQAWVPPLGVPLRRGGRQSPAHVALGRVLGQPAPQAWPGAEQRLVGDLDVLLGHGEQAGPRQRVHAAGHMRVGQGGQLSQGHPAANH